MNIAFFGSSLLSAYWNGAATYYRGLIRALHARGHQISFYEPDAYGRQAHRDLEPPPWCECVVYEDDPLSARRAVETAARHADLLVKASGVGAWDKLLEAAVLDFRSPRRAVAFWDVDAPATLERVAKDPHDPFLALIPRYDIVFTYGGGAPVVRAYENLGARACVPIYNALDPSTHFPVPPEERFATDLLFLGNRLPDREARADEFFFWPAKLRPGCSFLLGGSGWENKPAPANVRRLGHVGTADHNALNASARAVLNVCRDSMARCGWSPATRVFEAAGAGACILSDAWEGIEEFFEPEDEILVARNGAEVVALLADDLDPNRTRAIGRAAYRRVLADHTYAQRAEQVEEALDANPAEP